MASTIHSLVPAVAGWLALSRGEYGEDSESARIVAWALVDGEDGGREVVGLVLAPEHPCGSSPPATPRPRSRRSSTATAAPMRLRRQWKR
jgi:hypothetical protein